MAKQPLRILISYNTANDSRSVSGVLKHFLLIGRAWVAQGVEVDFLAARAGFTQIRSFLPEAGLISSDNLFNADKYIEKTWAYFPAYGWRLVTSHFTRLRRYDVVYASSPMIFETYPAMIAARRTGAILAAKFHHVLKAQAKRTGMMDRLFLWSERKSMRWIYRHAEVIFASTGPVVRDVRALQRELGFPERKIHQVGYGLDMSLFRPPASQPRYDAVILGRLHVHKGVLELPDVWAQVVAARPGASLLVIGEGPHRPLVEAAFEKLGLRSSVTFTGGVPELEKNDLLAQSKLGLSLSFEEGWGLSVNEFLAAGIPAIVYDLPIYHEIFPNLLVSVLQGDKQAMARQILRLLADDDLRRILGHNGRDYVKRYDYREIAQAELDAIKEALATKRRD
ncbi:MAG: glycosyltransferase family 4 protein [Limisphaerales bacterium]